MHQRFRVDSTIEVCEHMCTMCPTHAQMRSPEHNPRLLALFGAGGFLEGGPTGPAAQALLLTQYHVRDSTLQSPLTIKW